MIFGSVRVTERAVETHRDSYLLAHLTVVSVRRPFLGGGLLLAFGVSAFVIAFSDLLYPLEIGVLAILVILGLLASLHLGQIQLLSRDLRGSELSGMIWGSHRHLHRIRRQIMAGFEASGQRDREQEARALEHTP